MAQESEGDQLLKAQQHLGPILRFIANQPVGIPPSSLANFGAVGHASGGHASGGPESVASVGMSLPTSDQGAARSLSSLKHMPQTLLSPAATSVPQTMAMSSYTPQEPVYYHASAPQPAHSVSSHAVSSLASAASADDGSIHRKPSLSQGSVDNDSADDDDEDSTGAASSSLAISSRRKSDHRRAAHTSAEQKRRDDIKHGYEDLATLIPSCQANNNGQKLSKAIILQRSIDYLGYLKKHRQQQEQDLAALRNEVVALRIMKRNYEQIAKAHHSLPPEKTPQVSDATKFEVFKAVMDTLFQSFDACISVSTFEVLSSSIFQWLEEFCKPQNMRGIVISSLQTLQKQPPGPMYGRS